MRLLVAQASDVVTWETVIVALAAGAIGSLITAVIAFGARIARIGREIDANDRAMRNIDDHLERWVSDATIKLVRDLRTTRNELNKEGLFNSGEYPHRIGLVKEAALHAYRDQENTARSQAAEIRARKAAYTGSFAPGVSPTISSFARRIAYLPCLNDGRRRRRSI